MIARATTVRFMLIGGMLMTSGMLTACNGTYAGYTEYRAAPPPKSEVDIRIERENQRRNAAMASGNGPTADMKPL